MMNEAPNKVGNVTHYVDLSVETNGKRKEMCFLVSDIGQEDAILGYLSLAAFELQFS